MINKIELNDGGKSPSIFSIVSGKGGTGKSIISTSIAYVLAHCGKKVLLVDLDLFTHGLTFYALAEYPRISGFSTSDIFKDGNGNNIIDTVRIPSEFVKGNLSLAPSISKTQRPTSELKLNQKYNDCISFSNRVTELLNGVLNKEDYDYILIDTRGGTDATSVGAVLASDYFIIVTEADKPSWDMGRLLADTIDATISEASNGPERIGFVINKNVLPSEAIEAFLRKEWQAPHLATIPLDEAAVRYFQEDKVPPAESVAIPFSIGILRIIRKSFLDKSWEGVQQSHFDDLWDKAKAAEAAKKKRKEEQDVSSKFAVLMRIYGTAISTALLGFLGISIVRDIGNESMYLVFVVISALLIFFMTASDPKVMIKILEMFVRRKR